MRVVAVHVASGVLETNRWGLSSHFPNSEVNTGKCGAGIL